ncbi:MAG: leucyl/phenylalanyl-tRNA--protein transferase [Ignavibacteriae bacterium HGW-Ignavibacteriae-3]|nr:MAG: leucyl/phenylalanyl-tRNA--protein transferase [Ignavibacteriae bacterium HGW-Ignavibacteriae-3]
MNNGEFLSDKELLIPENMIVMYSKGAFPMADETGEINWYMPEQRTIIPLDKFNIPRSLKKYIQNAEFEYEYDKRTIKVVEFCAKRESTWISDELIEAYIGLQKLGHLHSVEVYNKSELVGGLYGVTYRGAFFGESMFSIVPQASKCALVKLIERLIEKDFILLDVQYQSEHLKMFGSTEISFDKFAHLLFKALTKDVAFS